jgi:6-pyruvoyltetrahydropterin/6-carboxytetrahydropterin synthase
MTHYRAIRYHDFSYGHTVCGHESKCAYLHGHNGRVTFHCEADRLDTVGRVIDFSVMKSTLCEWIELNWDHKFLVSEDDPRADPLHEIDPIGTKIVSFNPTAENMADYLLHVVGPQVLRNTGVTLVKVEMSETRKCSATAHLEGI